MGLLQIDLGKPRIALDQAQRAVAQQALKAEEVAAAPRAGGGKRLPKGMGVSVLDLSRIAQTIDEVPERIPRDAADQR
jgi:hypothetical protein